MTLDAPPSQAESRRWRVAIIGGGISGLAAAHRLQELCREAGRPLDLTQYEAGPRLGGVIETRRIGDYLVETGPDMFITDKPWALDLCRRLGLEDRLMPTDTAYRGSLVLRRGKPVRVPEGFTLLAPAKVWPVLRSPIFSPWGKLRMGCEYFLPRRCDETDESLADFVRRRFGREALERLIQPLVGGIYTADPEKLSLQATLPRFIEMERRHGSLIRGAKSRESRVESREHSESGARYGLFVTLANGLSELIDVIERRIGETASVRLNTTVENIDGDPLSITSRSTDDQGRRTKDHFDTVIVALPAHAAGQVLEPLDTELAQLLRQIEYASSAVVVSGHKLADVRDPLAAFGLVVPAVERRRVLAVSYGSRKFSGRAPEGCVLLRTFVGGAMQPELLDLSDDKLLEVVRGELRDLLGVTGHTDFATVVRWPQSMPQYHVGHLDLVGRIKSHVEEMPGLELAGNAYDGVGIPDCIRSGEQAAERAFAHAAAVERGR